MKSFLSLSATGRKKGGRHSPAFLVVQRDQTLRWVQGNPSWKRHHMKWAKCITIQVGFGKQWRQTHGLTGLAVISLVTGWAI